MRRVTLITGGAGFVGCNLADRLLGEGQPVVILDNLSRRGTIHNLDWLRLRHGDDRLEHVDADVRDQAAVADAVARADRVFHLAAQVAVTSSVADPRTDFEINARGTLEVLEAARLSRHRPVVVYTSTNKVYGDLPGVRVVEAPTRYECPEHPDGIDESQPLDFHSPYGCSKGAMDQYVRDYARIYGLPTVVVRMSCIYGPHQFGNEDQGWLAHFLIRAALGQPLTIYGDGKQVRDVLFVEDLVEALIRAADRIGRTAGQIYNLGGGPANTLAVWSEFGPQVRRLAGRGIAPEFGDWRPGDQRWYVSDIRKAARDLDWQPAIAPAVGARRLWAWVKANEGTLRAVAQPPWADHVPAG